MASTREKSNIFGTRLRVFGKKVLWKVVSPFRLLVNEHMSFVGGLSFSVLQSVYNRTCSDLVNGTTYFLTVALEPSKLLGRFYKETTSSKALTGAIMHGFREFISNGEIPLRNQDGIDLNLRKARSEENIHKGSFSDPWWVRPERYSSTHSTDDLVTSHVSAFSTCLGLNSPHLRCIPLPPTAASLLPQTSQTFLVPQNMQTVQSRYYLRQTPSINNSSKKSIDDISEIMKVLSKRRWQEVQSKKKSSKSIFEFTLMSYNVLAQNLLNEHPYLYKNHDQKSLDWRIRWKNLFNEIKTMRPDILCLQEVQEFHVPTYYSQLESLGYRGLFKRRTGIRCDGCAIYYKSDKLSLVEYETVEFYQPNVDVLNRDNIAIIATLCPSHCPTRHFVVATTHLLYNPKRQDVRLAQTQLLLTEVERMSFHWSSSGKQKYWPIIITGDFNSTPDSAVYKLITEGCLKYDHLAAKRMHVPGSPRHGNVLVPSHLEITDACQHAGLVERRRKNEDISRAEEAALIKLHNSDKTVAKITTEIVKSSDLFGSGTLRHLFAFKSVYNHGETDNPEGSTFQDEWITVDYIFYSGKKKVDCVKDHKLKLVAGYRLPLKNELGSLKIPNKLIGSDHLSLAAKFRMRI